jgi:hypothetical protein
LILLENLIARRVFVDADLRSFDANRGSEDCSSIESILKAHRGGERCRS